MRDGGDRWMLGLMSGMSRDGVDVALVRIRGVGDGPREVDLVHARTEPYPPALRARLARAVGGDLAEVAALHLDLPAVWAPVVLDVLREAGVRPTEIAALGSHGQTVFHRPRNGNERAVTLQIGHGDVLAMATGVRVVADFRVRDVVSEGEGAPLVPLADLLVFGRSDEARACWNLGSIANVTLLPAGGTDVTRCGVVAFDTGPANALIDAFVGTADAAGIDRDGALSARGRVDEDLLADLVARRRAWLDRSPPKSAGYATWGPDLASSLVGAHEGVALADRVRTAVEATARLMRDAWDRHVVPRRLAVRRVILSGGGCRNPTLLAAIRASFADLDLAMEPLEPAWSDAKEAIAFALLADETLHGRAGNLPSATGASRAVRLGTVFDP